MNKDEFKLLQKDWYQRLADVGFRDIEADGEPSHRHVNQTKRETDEQYFDILRMLVNHQNTVWKREIDRRILTLYSEGRRILDICHILRMEGDSRGRGAIRFIIRRYEHAWKIRSHSRAQRHLRSLS